MKTKEAFLYTLLRPLICFLVAVLFRPTIKGAENIPKSGPVVIAGTHTNYCDCVLMIKSTKRHIHFLAKKELWKFPQGILFSNMGLIPVDRSRKSHDSLESAYEYLEDGKLVGIFPEGTTRKNSKLLPFKVGAAKMAYVSGATLVPFVITGKYKLLSRPSIEYLPPIEVSYDLLETTERLRAVIEAKLGEE